MQKVGLGLLALVVAIGFAIATLTAYDAGQHAADSALDCTEGAVLSITETQKAPTAGASIDKELTRTVSVGDCERIGEAAFASAMEALAPTAAVHGDKECVEPPKAEDPKGEAPTTTTGPPPAEPGTDTTTTTVAADGCPVSP